MISRRTFLGTAAAAALALNTPATAADATTRPTGGTLRGVRRLRSVTATLGPGRHRDQVVRARDTYLGLGDDSLLHGFRKRAGKPAPGTAMGGWCSRDSGVIFGQLVSGMARLSHYLNDPALAAKAAGLHAGWMATVGPDGDAHAGTYEYDKFVCGMVDLKQFAGHDVTADLARVTAWAARSFDRSRSPGGPLDWDGRKPKGTGEWYTLGENLYRAYALTGDDAYRAFADVWQYPFYWDKLAATSRPATAFAVHAYSHVNTFSSAAMAYAVTGQPHYLDVIVHAHDYLMATQCYATGGYGPIERLLEPGRGLLGRSLSYVTDHAEVGCGSWAAFKLGKYLLEFTGDGRFGDWVERVYHNGIGAALPVQGDGRTYYYADYRPSGAEKHYYQAAWPCCAGTYIQAVADYHALVYFRDDDGLYVNLYTPAEATETFAGAAVTVRQETKYPESPEATFAVTCPAGTSFGLSFRVPGWCDGMTVAVNGARVDVKPERNWLAIRRAWAAGDRVTVTLPMRPRVWAIDEQNPDRSAIACGPVVLVQDAAYTRPLTLRSADELDRKLVATDKPLHYRAKDDAPVDIGTGPFRPFYAVGAAEQYRMYHDLREPYLY